ncbi:MAG: phosphodiester glycosidase family protein [Limnochordia bacterium]|nr:phosphodiester glycosidase family protein [Limnochordia bacterium]
MRRFLVALTLVCGLLIPQDPVWALDLSAIAALPFMTSSQLTVEHTPYDGIVLYRLEQATPRPLLIHIMQVDLSNGNISLDLLLGDNVLTRPRTITSMVEQQRDIVAACNSDFFYISSTQSPVGLAIKDSVIIKSDNPELKRPCFGWDNAGKGYIGYWSWHGELVIPAINQVYPIATLNDIHIPSEGLVMYNWMWGTKLPQNIVQQANLAITVLDNLVSDIQPDPLGITVNKEAIYLLAFGATGDELREQARLGTEVLIQQSFDGPDNLQLAVCGYPMLIEDGVVQRDFPDWLNGPNPRTAVGLNKQGTTLTLVVVDGRSQVSYGLTLDQLAQLLKTIGLHSALNFDGGGSSTMVLRQPMGRAMVVNTLPGNTQRAVPVALALGSVPTTILSRADVWVSVAPRYATYSLTTFEQGSFKIVSTPESHLGSLDITQGPAFEDGTTPPAAKLTFSTSTTLRRREISLMPETPVKLPGGIKQLGVWVYSEQEASFPIEAVILDINGEPHRLVLADSIDWTGWMYIMANIPDTLQPETLTALSVVMPALTRGSLDTIYFGEVLAGVDSQRKPSTKWQIVP